MRSNEKRHLKAKQWVCIALILCLISSIGASLVQSSFGAVRVEDIQVILADGGLINGQIYIPKQASPENKLPLVVVSHGSYNNLDMQDLNMIELSRRGFVVISSDAYCHGSSSISEGGISQDNMWQLIDYACASFTFIDTEKVGVSGHSMGGMIASAAVQHFFEQEARGLGENKISAILDVGYDPQYTSYEFEGVAAPVDLAIDWGVIAAKYDEWFFAGETGNPALYLESDVARSFVNQLDGVDVTGAVENGKIYTGTIGGEEYIRVINQNVEIHPLNHFSKAAAAEAVTFFYEAFDTPSGYTRLDPNNQIWMYKEFLNLVGLIGIFLFLFPFAIFIMDSVPYFGVLRRKGELAIAPPLSTNKRKLGYWLPLAVNTVIPALLVVPIAFKLIGKESFVPATVTAWFGEPNTNELAGWTLAVAICLLAVFLIANKIFAEKDTAGIPECWGVKTSLSNAWRSFLLALLTVGAAYIVLFTSDLIFNTDYRIWVIAMRVFTVNKLVYAVAYFPAFALFYLVNSMLVNGGNRVEGMPDWQVTLISCISNIAGIAVLIFIQYSTLIGKGEFAFNSMRIVNLFPLIVLIPLATIITRRFFKVTGNIYLGSFTISMLYTMMTVSNTMFMASIL